MHAPGIIELGTWEFYASVFVIVNDFFCTVIDQFIFGYYSHMYNSLANSDY